MIRRRLNKAALSPALPVAAWAGQASAQAAPDASAGSLSQFIGSRLDHVGEHVGDLARAVPRLPDYFHDVGQAFEKGLGLTSVGHVVMATLLCLLVGAAVEGALRHAMRGLRARRHGRPVTTTSDRLTVVGIDFGVEVGGVLGFALGALAALLMVGRPGPINEAGSSILVAIVWLRLVLAALRVVLRPRESPDRAFAALPLDLLAARFWYRSLGAFVGWLAIGWAIVVTLRAFGMPQDGRFLIAYLLGTGLLIIAWTIVWRRGRSNAPPADGNNVGKWLASLAALVLWTVWAANAMPVFWFLAVAIGLPLAIRIARRASRHLLRPAEGEETGVPSVAAVFVEQGVRAALVAGAIWLLLWGWSLDVGVLAARENVYARLLRGGLHALVIVLAADLAWGLIKAVADNALFRAQATPEADADEARRRARVRTLLPIGRNLAFIVLLVMSGLMVLSSLGVEIGPLIASAGVVGVAVGFGAQTVVRDIISGMFYMLDDAFRVGEYIQSGNYKGTVESFSLRSIKLRHQRGPLFTIPFGTLGAVQNMSRDWVIVKDFIGISYDSDIDKAKKLIKQIGLELAKDPDLGPSILQPLKMQGVEQFDDYGMRVRTKMMTKPGEQFMVRRKANAMIKKAFDDNGIRFAVPKVQVAHDAENSSAAAATQVLGEPSADKRH